MKSHRVDGSRNKRILSALVMDPVVCSRIAAKWPREGLFLGDAENLLAGWCVQYFNKYNKPPERQIQVIFDQWASKRQNSEDKTVDTIERLLSEISNDYERQEPESSEYTVDLAGELFERVRIARLKDAIEMDLENNDIDSARKRIGESTKIDLGVGEVMRPAVDYTVWSGAFHQDESSQFNSIYYPGKLGNFFGQSFSRDALISFMGPDKSGKSFWLGDGVIRGLKCRCNVGYFEVGDLGRDETIRRLGCRILRRPLEEETIMWPVGWNDDGTVVQEKRKLSPVTEGAAFKALNKLCRGKDKLRISCHPNSSLSAYGIRSMLSDWAKDGWVVDVVVVDYADILAPPFGVKESLEQIDETWKLLRRIAQEFHCLVLTATQSSALAYDNKSTVLRKKHFAGRKTKLAHVNGMVGLNATDDEREQGITRVNWIVRRNKAYKEGVTLSVAGSLAIGSPVILI